MISEGIRSYLRETIIEILNARGVMRHIDLIDYCLESVSQTDQNDVTEIISELTMDSKIKRIEYMIPNAPNRRSIYFPFGTTIE